MVKRMLFLFILVFACFSQTNLNNDLDGNPISFHGIIPAKTTFSEAYDHLKYVVGLDNLSVLEASDSTKFLKGSIILDTTPKMVRIYFIYFDSDDQNNPTVWSIVTKTGFLQEDLMSNVAAMASLFFSVEGEINAEYGKPSEALPEKYYRSWKFSSDIYKSYYYLSVEPLSTEIIILKEKFAGEYKEPSTKD